MENIQADIRGPCVRKLLTGLIMYIYPLKIKNIVLYCIVLYHGLTFSLPKVAMAMAKIVKFHFAKC